RNPGRHRVGIDEPTDASKIQGQGKVLEIGNHERTSKTCPNRAFAAVESGRISRRPYLLVASTLALQALSAGRVLGHPDSPGSPPNRRAPRPARHSGLEEPVWTQRGDTDGARCGHSLQQRMLG